MSTLKAALLGTDISNSISPEVHKELFPLLRSRYDSEYDSIDYTLRECKNESDFAAWLQKAFSEGFSGANVTSPYKTQAYKFANIHIGVTAAIGSANTLTFRNKTIDSLSTDGLRLLSALLHEHPEFNLENYHLVTVGAGAAAKAVIYALLTKWMPMSLTIVSRSHDAAEELAEFCIAEAPGPTMRVLGFNDFLHTFEEQHYRLVLQATPVGSILHPGNLATGFPWHESDFAVDLVYNPHKTPFLRSAKEAGAKTLDGLGMLIVQAAFSQVYWLTGVLPEKSPITDAEYLALRESLSKLLK